MNVSSLRILFTLTLNYDKIRHRLIYSFCQYLLMSAISRLYNLGLCL